MLPIGTFVSKGKSNTNFSTQMTTLLRGQNFDYFIRIITAYFFIGQKINYVSTSLNEK